MEPQGHLACFLELPEDITRLVFEIAVEDDKGRPTLALISKQIQQWVEPIIYRDVLIDFESGQFYHTVTAPVSTKPADFFALHVKGLFFRFLEYVEENDRKAAEILHKCHSSVRSLAIWSYLQPEGTLPRLRTALTSPLLRPTQLSLSQFVLRHAATSNRDFSHPIFSRITHLDVTCRKKEGEWDWTSLQNLTALTHLSVDVYDLNPAQVAKCVLQNCPESLRVLVVCLSLESITLQISEDVKALAEGEVDDRVAVASLEPTKLARNFHLSHGELLDVWKAPSSGNKLWSLAERVVNERRGKNSEDKSEACH